MLAVNHHGYIDAPILGLIIGTVAKRKVTFITKQSVARFFRRLHLLRWLGMIGLENSHPSACLDEAAEWLKQGEVVGIFPEGKRNPNGELAQPKTGAARLAFRCGVPIVPVGIVMPEGMSAKEAICNAFNRRLPMSVRIGRSIPVSAKPLEHVTREDLDRLMAEVMLEIAVLSGKTFQS